MRAGVGMGGEVPARRLFAGLLAILLFSGITITGGAALGEEARGAALAGPLTATDTVASLEFTHAFSPDGGWALASSGREEQELFRYGGVGEGTLVDLARDDATSHDVGEFVEALEGSVLVSPLSGDPAETLPVASVADFSADGGFATLEPGTPRHEVISYVGIDASSHSLVGVARSEPVPHLQGAFIEAAERAAPLASPSPTGGETTTPSATPDSEPVEETSNPEEQPDLAPSDPAADDATTAGEVGDIPELCDMIRCPDIGDLPDPCEDILRDCSINEPTVPPLPTVNPVIPPLPTVRPPTIPPLPTLNPCSTVDCDPTIPPLPTVRPPTIPPLPTLNPCSTVDCDPTIPPLPTVRPPTIPPLPTVNPVIPPLPSPCNTVNCNPTIPPIPNPCQNIDCDPTIPPLPTVNPVIPPLPSPCNTVNCNPTIPPIPNPCQNIDCDPPNDPCELLDNTQCPPTIPPISPGVIPLPTPCNEIDCDPTIPPVCDWLNCDPTIPPLPAPCNEINCDPPNDPCQLLDDVPQCPPTIPPISPGVIPLPTPCNEIDCDPTIPPITPGVIPLPTPCNEIDCDPTIPPIPNPCQSIDCDPPNDPCELLDNTQCPPTIPPISPGVIPLPTLCNEINCDPPNDPCQLLDDVEQCPPTIPPISPGVIPLPTPALECAPDDLLDCLPPPPGGVPVPIPMPGGLGNQLCTPLGPSGPRSSADEVSAPYLPADAYCTDEQELMFSDPVPADVVLPDGSMIDAEGAGVGDGGSANDNPPVTEPGPGDVSEVTFDTPLGESDQTVSALAPIGEDSRRQVSNTRVHPYSAIADYGCTGWLVGRNTMVTAAHCMYDAENGYWKPRPSSVFPSRDGTTIPYDCEVRHRSVSAWYIQTGGNNDWDWGFMKLDCHVEATGASINVIENRTGGFAYSHSPRCFSGTVRMSGYPGFLDEEAPPGMTEPKTQWWGDGRIRGCTQFRIFYSTDSSGGQSGAPTFTNYTGCSCLTSVAIHSGGQTADRNRGTRIAQHVFTAIYNYKRRHN